MRTKEQAMREVVSAAKDGRLNRIRFDENGCWVYYYTIDHCLMVNVFGSKDALELLGRFAIDKKCFTD